MSLIVFSRRGLGEPLAAAVPSDRRHDAPARSMHPVASNTNVEDLSIDALVAIAAALASAVSGGELPLALGQRRDFARLDVTPHYEAWLIAWAPTGALELHDHGGSRGAIHLASGCLAETYSDANRDNRLQTRTVGPGSAVGVPADRIHEVWNPGPGAALSVHVYSPPLSSMTFFDRGVDGSLIPSRTRHGELATLALEAQK